MIMKQQSFNLRVLMSVALPFSLFLVAAVDGMEQDQGGHRPNSNGSGTEQIKSKEERTSKKKKSDKQANTARMVAAISRDDQDNNTNN